MLLSGLLILGGYLLGSFSSAIVVCKLLNLPDPRGQGSGNPGATNVLRFGGKKAAILVLVLDILKGFVPVILGHLVAVSPTVLALITLAAFLGHLYPVFFKFQGGKGVATAFGCLLALHWLVGLAVLATWLVMAFAFRYSSLSAITAAMLAPAYIFWFTGQWQYILLSAVMCALLLWRHRSNIHKLINGQEDQIQLKR